MQRLKSLTQHTGFAVAVVVLALLIVWYLAALWMNGQQLIMTLERTQQPWTYLEIARNAYGIARPPLPVPHQIAIELYNSIVNQPITSRRSLLYHTIITLNSTLLGFAMGSILGILIAVGIVHNRTLNASLMPWVIASQTVPILAIAPIIVVVLGSINITGILPKAMISMYLSFFPVTIGMVKGLRSADKLHMELMMTYNASAQQMFWKLRWFSAQPYLFASLKIAISAALVGAIVAELPTGAQGGLGARLLSGSYYGQTIQIWAALIMSALLGWFLITLVGLAERWILKRRGAVL
ncbi:ABC transporter permease [Nitrincola nitratireducens]|uniref:Bicarbonate transport system permease protein CmpB n=1 Tax=Nitrincola nitratireducens TaxID=1229521 RepID=W9UTK9_9GAMM|nr:ABC transporter permease [Nitrincola nitratireducens]EXJ10568.1 Bicarbonate transport system permease protein CmpB [Nitrincola nitratireducens]